MEIHIEDGLEKSRYQQHIETVTEQFSPLPDPFVFLVYEDPDSPENVIGTTDIQPRSLLEEACRRKSSSSFTVNDIDIIIIRIDDPFLKDNDDALKGLIAHEVIHAVHRETGLEEEIEDASTQYSDLVLNRLANYEMTKDEAIDFLRDVVSTAVFCLKDIHANTDIIEAGFGDELAEYYYHQLGIDSYCPLPRFYQDETSITQIKEAVAFELQLTPAWLPFKKHDNERAKRMQEQIEECYELNIPETAKAIHGICSLYEQAYDDDRFIESFYDTLFEEIFDLVDLKLQD
ncbi:MAG: hypothetical protein MUP66_00965 [Candidatus Nanohaloarchaeota archaeon QJJ-5]|nr:hypothetical protein [Candidatus Nanohaloarchaeota archaeon QJJ-5]